MADESNIVADGWTTVEGGMDSGRNPSTLPANKLSVARNVTMRGGYVDTRPGWMRRTLTFDSDEDQNDFRNGNFQGAGFFDLGGGSHYVASISGVLWRVYNSDWRVQKVVDLDANSKNLTQAWFEQVEADMVVQDGQSKAIILSANAARRATSDEVPVGKMMAYGNGRLWVTLPDQRHFVAGDLYGTTTGPLKFTENTFLNGGGSFSVWRGFITGMKFKGSTDASIGQGPLLIFTRDSVISINVPIDRDEWQNTQYPPQTVAVLGLGSTGHRSIVNVNGDVFMRAVPGISSVVEGRRTFQSWGNTPLSSEMNRLLAKDEQLLLDSASAVLFDNRLITTFSPTWNQRHVAHRGVVVLDFDLVSGITTKEPPAWDGYWTGEVLPLQLVSGVASQAEQAIMFACNSQGEIQLWEISKDESFDHDGTDDVRIKCMVESRAMAFTDRRRLKQLRSGEVSVDRVSGLVDFVMRYIPDQYPCWVNWHDWCLQSAFEDCNDDPDVCVTPQTYRETYKVRTVLPWPSDECNALIGRPFRIGHEFQFRMEWTGKARVKWALFLANREDDDLHTGDY